MPFKKSKHFKFLYKIDILVIFLLLIGFSSLSINLYIIFNWRIYKEYWRTSKRFKVKKIKV